MEDKTYERNHVSFLVFSLILIVGMICNEVERLQMEIHEFDNSRIDRIMYLAQISLECMEDMKGTWLFSD